MEQKRKALGKGLEQLFNNETFIIEDFEKSIVESTNKEDIKMIPIIELRSNPYQPRKKFDEEKLNELAESIKQYGIIEPIIAKKSIKGYEIIAGERRTKAARIAGLTEVPAVIKDFTDAEMMEIALLENIQRENLTVIEEAVAYKALIDNLGLTQEELSKKLGKSRSHVTNILGILNLPRSVQSLVGEGKLSMGHARVLSKLSDLDQINDLTNRVVEENLSVRALEDIVDGNFERRISIKKKRIINEKHLQIQGIMREKIGTMVKVNNKNIVIPFDNDKDLERILEIININMGNDYDL